LSHQATKLLVASASAGLGSFLIKRRASPGMRRVSSAAEGYATTRFDLDHLGDKHYLRGGYLLSSVKRRLSWHAAPVLASLRAAPRGPIPDQPAGGPRLHQTIIERRCLDACAERFARPGDALLDVGAVH
jgi:hypothetical protein